MFSKKLLVRVLVLSIYSFINWQMSLGADVVSADLINFRQQVRDFSYYYYGNINQRGLSYTDYYGSDVDMYKLNQILLAADRLYQAGVVMQSEVDGLLHEALSARPPEVLNRPFRGQAAGEELGAYAYPPPGPLLLAMLLKDKHLVDILIQHGACVNAEIIFYLAFSLSGDDRLEAFEMLDLLGVNIDVTDSYGGYNTALAYAFNKCNYYGCGHDCIDFLLKRGADPTKVVNDGSFSAGCRELLRRAREQWVQWKRKKLWLILGVGEQLAAGEKYDIEAKLEAELAALQAKLEADIASDPELAALQAKYDQVD